MQANLLCCSFTCICTYLYMYVCKSTDFLRFSPCDMHRGPPIFRLFAEESTKTTLPTTTTSI